MQTRGIADCFYLESGTNLSRFPFSAASSLLMHRIFPYQKSPGLSFIEASAVLHSSETLNLSPIHHVSKGAFMSSRLRKNEEFSIQSDIVE